MENKANEATPQRPEGDRVLNAALVAMDLPRSIEQLKSETTWRESDRNSITLFKSDVMRIVLIGLHAGAELPTHTANGIISVQVVHGKVSFTADPQTESLSKGQMIALQPAIPHSVRAEEESFFLLTLVMVKTSQQPQSGVS